MEDDETRSGLTPLVKLVRGMQTPVDPKATEENATVTNVFNSVHIVGERPR